MRWKLPIGIALSALFLYLALRDARLDQVSAALRSADYLWMVPVVALTLVSFAIRALRWRFLLAGVDRPRFHPLFASTMIGFMGNNVLPARLGELLRVYAIGDRAGISRSAALGSIVVERILDIFVLLGLFSLIFLAGRLPVEVGGWGRYLLWVALPLLGGVALFRVRPEPFLRLLGRCAPDRIRQRLYEMAVRFHSGLGVMGDWRAMVAATSLSLLMWACLIGVVVLCFASLHLSLPADAGVVVLVVMAIGTMIPSGPGFIGTLQYAGTLALTQYRVDPSLALSFTLVYHASQWFPVTAIGLGYFVQSTARGRRRR